MCQIPKTHVRVTNDLGGDLTLSVHCKSKDDDIGVQVLPPHASFQFSFRPHVTGLTLFFCGFRWPGEFRWFDIYTAMRDQGVCFNCFWSIGPDGPCMFNEESQKYDICYSWNRN
ncbi:hypothetical protein GBA52_005141 [Prunus armeniaca]|nr:hypothetical protein GBA52_005141 [Prunus armeniaca]